MKPMVRSILFILMVSLLISLMQSCSCFADFTYLERVIILKGFYMGNRGAVLEKVDGGYKIKILPEGRIVVVAEDEIQGTSDR